MLKELLYGIFLSSFFLVLGAFIWKKGKVNFFAGVREGMLKNEKKLAKQIGKVIIAFGFETMLLIVVNVFIINVDGFFYGVLAILHILIVLFLLVMDQLNH
ncbi:hypothetical protein C174_02314 [Bacillus mycoides FSL H7-687]|nr:hypothetical protein C174_02314 [Bacillus mycoides FSL H7-687]